MHTERPLDDHELRVLRGMMEEHTIRMARARLFSDFFIDAKATLTTLAVVIAIALQAVEVVLLLTHSYAPR